MMYSLKLKVLEGTGSFCLPYVPDGIGKLPLDEGRGGVLESSLPLRRTWRAPK